jgi:hypothetical protein
MFVNPCPIWLNIAIGNRIYSLDEVQPFGGKIFAQIVKGVAWPNDASGGNPFAIAKYEIAVAAEGIDSHAEVSIEPRKAWAQGL